MTNDIQAMREKIYELGRMLFDRNLTDAAGGNISARMGEFVLISPRYAGALTSSGSKLISFSERSSFLKESAAKYGKSFE